MCEWEEMGRQKNNVTLKDFLIFPNLITLNAN